MNVRKELGLKIKRLRTEQGLTQEQFAEKINVATRTLAGIEIGKTFVSANTIERILDFCNVTFEDFMASSHLRPTDELLKDIYTYLDKIKNDRTQVENIYKIIKALTID